MQETFGTIKRTFCQRKVFWKSAVASVPPGAEYHSMTLSCALVLMGKMCTFHTSHITQTKKNARQILDAATRSCAWATTSNSGTLCLTREGYIARSIENAEWGPQCGQEGGRDPRRRKASTSWPQPWENQGLRKGAHPCPACCFCKATTSFTSIVNMLSWKSLSASSG